MSGTQERRIIFPSKAEAAELSAPLPTVEEGMLGKIFSTSGREIGWYNKTAEPDKIADAEILMVSAQEIEFVKMHHRLRDVLEANAFYKAAGLIRGSYELPEIYRRIDRGLPLVVEWPQDGKLYKISLVDLAHLIRIEKVNKLLGKYAINIDKLRHDFVAGQELKVTIGNKTIDLCEKGKPDDLKDFDFDEYIDRVKNNQIGFQSLGLVRDEAMGKHHIENASHTLFLDVGRVDPRTGNRVLLWMPVCKTISNADQRADLGKTKAMMRAGGHVHEVGQYCENNGSTVAFEYELLQKHRQDVSWREHNETNQRFYNAAVGMTVKESATVLPSVKTERGTLNKVCVGGLRNGGIYTGLHATWDEGMLGARGSKLTDEEADDIIFTRIIAPFIANNPTDWLLCLSKAIKSSTGYTPEKAVGRGGDNWSEFGKQDGGTGFCVAIPCRDGDPKDKGLKTFYNYSDLIIYINNRIKEGVEGIPASVSVSPPKPEKVGKNGMPADDDKPPEADDGEEDEIEVDVEGVAITGIDKVGVKKEVAVSEFKHVATLLKKIFGDDLGPALRSFALNSVDAEVNIKGSSKIFIEFVKEQLAKSDYSKELSALFGVTGVEGVEVFEDMLKNMDEVKRGELYDYAINKAERKGGPESKIMQAIERATAGMGDVALVMKRCGGIIGRNPPGHGEFENLPGMMDKETILIDGSRWNRVVNQAAKILAAIRTNKEVKTMFGENAKDARWLWRQALTQSGVYKELK